MSFVQPLAPRMACFRSWLLTAARLAPVGTFILLFATVCGFGDARRVAAVEPAPVSLVAPSSETSASSLRSAIESARTNLSAERLPKPAVAKQRLVEQMQAFEAYLGGVQSPNAQAWFKFLYWDVLLRELAAPQPDLRALTDVEMRYRQNIVGLEYEPFQAMRAAISDFIDAQRFGANPEGTVKALDAQLERLITLTEENADVSELQRARDFGLMTGYLASSNQAPELVAAMRGHYAQPNVRLLASESLITRAVGRPVHQPAPVNECILGTQVVGNSIVSGNLVAQLVPQQNGISLYLCLGANFSSNNVGYNRGVKIYTTGYAPVQASKLITITPSGTFTQPAVANANLQTQINGIEHRLRLVRRIASRKAEEQKPQANAIGQHRLQSRLAQQFNAQVEQQLAERGGGGLSVLNQNRVELARLGVPKPEWSVQSTDSHVFATFREADVTQFAAPAPSRLPHPGTDVVAEVHQSLPINLADSVLGGRTVHSWEMDDFVRQFSGNVTAELQAESEGEPWSLTFADHHPVEVQFADGVATIALRISKLTRGDQELNQPATVTAQYRPVIAEGILVFERQGEVQLDFVRAPTGIRAVTLRSFLKGKFDRFFRERTEPRSLVFGQRMPNMPPLVLSNVVFAEGWAQVSLR